MSPELVDGHASLPGHGIEMILQRVHQHFSRNVLHDEHRMGREVSLRNHHLFPKAAARVFPAVGAARNIGKRVMSRRKKTHEMPRCGALSRPQRCAGHVTHAQCTCGVRTTPDTPSRAAILTARAKAEPLSMDRSKLHPGPWPRSRRPPRKDIRPLSCSPGRQCCGKRFTARLSHAPPHTQCSTTVTCAYTPFPHLL